MGLEDRLRDGQAVGRQHALVLGDDLHARRGLLDRVHGAVDAIAPGLLHLVGEQRDLRLAAEVLVDPLARVVADELGASEVVEDHPAVGALQRLVGVVEELHVRLVRLLDQRRHRVVVERQHDHATDALPDPRVELVDLRVELAVGVALEQLVAAALGGGLRAGEQQRVEAGRGVGLGERDLLRVPPARRAGVRGTGTAQCERTCARGPCRQERAAVDGPGALGVPDVRRICHGSSSFLRACVIRSRRHPVRTGKLHSVTMAVKTMKGPEC